MQYNEVIKIKLKASVAFAKKADRTAYDAAEPNGGKCRVMVMWSRCPWLLQTRKFSAVRFFAVCCGWTIHHTAIKRPKKWIGSFFLSARRYNFQRLHQPLAPQYTTFQTDSLDGQTDRQTTVLWQ